MRMATTGMVLFIGIMILDAVNNYENISLALEKRR